MLFFGVCFFLYFIKLSAGNGVFLLHLSCQACMLIIACTHSSAVLVISHSYTLRNEKSHRHIIQYDFSGCVIRISRS